MALLGPSHRDGKVDFDQERLLNEPSFIPAVPFGKVLVSTYIADEHGRIPDEPQQVFRKNDWTPMVPVADVDGDGFPDLVLGYSRIEDKEGLRKMITSKKLAYNLRFYFYRPGFGFPTEADCQRDVVIHLDRDRAEMLEGLHQLFGCYVKVGGDLTGMAKRICWCGTTVMRSRFTFLFAGERVQPGTGPAIQLPEPY